MHPNVVAVRAFYRAQAGFYAGMHRAASMRSLLTEDVAWHVPGRSVIAGDYLGQDEVLDYFARRRDIAGGSLRVDVRRSLADNDLVVQLTAGQAELAGPTCAWEALGVYRMIDGLIAECWLVPFDQYRFDQIWSPPGPGRLRSR